MMTVETLEQAKQQHPMLILIQDMRDYRPEPDDNLYDIKQDVDVFVERLRSYDSYRAWGMQFKFAVRELCCNILHHLETNGLAGLPYEWFGIDYLALFKESE